MRLTIDGDADTETEQRLAIHALDMSMYMLLVVSIYMSTTSSCHVNIKTQKKTIRQKSEKMTALLFQRKTQR